ncbi:MAG TPA: lamin tail domain-containing protein, partial [Clostridia bacterium]|nr:lamin tail domain-containing protein [Clostridia bacterium]
QGRALQLQDPRQDGWRVGNWTVIQRDSVATPKWMFVSTNITAASSTIYMHLGSPGDIYIDDLKLAQGAGPNLIVNGDFESALNGSWTAAAPYAQSALSTVIKHGGNSSLHLVGTAAGNGSGNSLSQTIASVNQGQTYTLSFWYLQTTNGGPLTVGLSSSSNPAVVNPAPPLLLGAAPATPGAANSAYLPQAPFPTLWINELQTVNLTGITNSAGQRTAWLEIYNPSSSTVALNGLYLANNYTNLGQWAFPANATISPRQFKVIFADGQTNLSTLNELHTSFSLPSGGGVVTLSRINTNGQFQVLDYLSYTNFGANRSYGSFADGQSFTRQEFYYPTPGGTNNGSSAPLTVAINEWMAGNTLTIPNPLSGKYSDWFELYNYGSNAVDLAGYFLTDSLTNQFKFQIPSGYQIPPRGFLLVWADGKLTNGTPDLHVSFKLSKTGGSIGLYGIDGRSIDFVTYTAMNSDVSMGRYPDGLGSLFTLPAATPRTSNVGPNSAPVISDPGTQTVYVGRTLAFTVQASDPDQPSQALTYGLGAGAPYSSSIDPSSGLFTWTPTAAQGPSTNSIMIVVADNGNPPMNASRTFDVVVLKLPSLVPVIKNDGSVTMSFQSEPGKHYRLTYSDNLSVPGWTPYGPDQTGTGGELSVSIAISGTPHRFYRLEVLP